MPNQLVHVDESMQIRSLIDHKLLHQINTILSLNSTPWPLFCQLFPSLLLAMAENSLIKIDYSNKRLNDYPPPRRLLLSVLFIYLTPVQWHSFNNQSHSLDMLLEASIRRRPAQHYTYRKLLSIVFTIFWNYCFLKYEIRILSQINWVGPWPMSWCAEIYLLSTRSYKGLFMLLLE